MIDAALVRHRPLTWSRTHLPPMCRLDFSLPRKPTDDAFIKLSDARVRAECLKEHVLEWLEHPKNILTSWRSDYDEILPDSALGMLTPEGFAELSQRNEVPLDQSNSAPTWTGFGIKTIECVYCF